jgi:hypothetical protein
MPRSMARLSNGAAAAAAILSFALLAQSATAAGSGAPQESGGSSLGAQHFAQAGSVGGSIGKGDKSVSGGEPEARMPKHEVHKRTPVRQASTNSGGVSRFDGAWKVITAPRVGGCDPYSTDAAISGGVVSSAGFTGSVTGGGTLNGVFSLAGYTAAVTGHLSGSGGTGTFRRSDGCAGQWTMVRR